MGSNPIVSTRCAFGACWGTSPGAYWESALLLLVALIGLLLRFVPGDEWAKWRSGFVPYGHKDHEEGDDPADPDDLNRG